MYIHSYICIYTILIPYCLDKGDAVAAVVGAVFYFPLVELNIPLASFLFVLIWWDFLFLFNFFFAFTYQPKFPLPRLLPVLPSPPISSSSVSPNNINQPWYINLQKD